MNKKIFIGGTGRSGTSILSKLIGSQVNTKTLGETRFIIDKNGLIDLFYSLTKNYSIDQGRIALKEFETMMVKHMTRKYSLPYQGFNFNNKFTDRYQQYFYSFFNELHFGTFQGYDFHSTYNNKIKRLFSNHLLYLNAFYRHTANFFTKRHNNLFFSMPYEDMYIPRYFDNPQELLRLISNFVNSIFISATPKDTNKNNWCEDTPANILHLDFLGKVFPDAYFLHITRHPVGVAYSMQMQFWAPNSKEQVVTFLTGEYEKLCKAKDIANKMGLNYLELKLEHLHKINKQKEIFDFLGLDFRFENKVTIQSSKVDYYLDKISAEDFDYFASHLKKYIYCFNYQ